MLILSLPLTRKLSNFYMPPSSQSMEHGGWRLGRISIHCRIVCSAVNLWFAVEVELFAAKLWFAAEPELFAANLGVVVEVELAAANLRFAAETEFSAAN
jgi:hypothetical protein